MAHKVIISRQHLDAFLSSPTHTEVVVFLEQLNTSVVGKTLQSECCLGPAVAGLLTILDSIDAIIDETPPVDNEKSRFGNPAFRIFYDTVQKSACKWLSELPNFPSERATEVATYLIEAWGNRTRIDYGSGMELNFLCWLLCLHKLAILNEVDHASLVLRVFWRYMQIMRKLQSQYWLEPAGSHGAYGLDDYHFLPFVFGSAQLRGHKHIKPKAIHDPDVLEAFSENYMYLACIRFVNSIKTASLRWHSPMLDDISAVKTWDKVNSGMIKMYQAEVLAKLPVAQHFLFSRLLPFPDVDIDSTTAYHDQSVHVDSQGHVHVQGEGFGDCCGIPIPSAFAAAQAERQKHGMAIPASSNVRAIPFD